jgi:DNA-binding MarR family transcriptional regulator
MTSSTTRRTGQASRRRRTTEIKASLRGLGIQLSLLNRQVGTHLELKDVDFHCLDLINRFGPLSPTTLARYAGLHPATMTGILDRLQHAGWILRERGPEATDRRAVTVRALRERNNELYALLTGMNTSMDEIFARYTDDQLDVIADFLQRTTDAGRDATDELAGR